MNAPTVDIAVEEPAWTEQAPGIEARLRRAVEETLARAGGAPGDAPVEVSLLLSNEDRSRVLNRGHRGRDKPTNVLAFPLQESWPPTGHGNDPSPVMLGDVVLCFQTCRQEARDQDKNFVDHALHLVVHGTLHLLGYDHQSADDAHVMEKYETEILAGLGVPDPYKNASSARLAT